MEILNLKQSTMDRIIILEKIIDRQMTQFEGSRELNLSQRQIRRLIKRYRSEGAKGLEAKYSKASNREIGKELQNQVLTIIQNKYQDFGPTLISEKLEELDSLKISRETLRKWMIKSELWKGKKRKAARIHQSRERRERFGELVQIDGSPHDWFEGRRDKCCLIVMIDDATSKIIHARFEEAETTFGYMRAIKEHLKNYGRPIAYYSDKHSIFKTSRERKTKDGIYEDTQLHRALKQLNIDLICANSPQAKGRVERANQTLQDRLIKDMRLEGISSLEDGNNFLKQFIPKYNNKFGVEASSKEDAHRPVVQKDEELTLILSIKEIRKISKNLEFSLKNVKYQIQNAGKGYRMQQGHVAIYHTSCGQLKVIYDGKELAYKVLYENAGPVVIDSKELNLVINNLIKDINLTKLCELSTIPHPHQYAQKLA